MTNIFKTPEKVERKERLFEIGVQTLQGNGWTVTRESGLHKASVRRITKNGKSLLVSIRTTQDQWIAFPAKANGKGWNTLDDVDVVLAVSVDSKETPSEALVHWLDASEMRKRFDSAAKARSAAGRVTPHRRGVWIPLYMREDESENVSYVGGGAGLDHPPIARVPLSAEGSPPSGTRPRNPTNDFQDDDGDLTIAAAKRGLSRSFGVPESSIKITIEA